MPPRQPRQRWSSCKPKPCTQRWSGLHAARQWSAPLRSWWRLRKQGVPQQRRCSPQGRHRSAPARGRRRPGGLEGQAPPLGRRRVRPSPCRQGIQHPRPCQHLQRRKGGAQPLPLHGCGRKQLPCLLPLSPPSLTPLLPPPRALQTPPPPLLRVLRLLHLYLAQPQRLRPLTRHQPGMWGRPKRRGSAVLRKQQPRRPQRPQLKQQSRPRSRIRHRHRQHHSPHLPAWSLRVRSLSALAG